MKKILTIVLALMVAMTFSFAIPQTACAASKPGKIKKIIGFTEAEKYLNETEDHSIRADLYWHYAKNAKKYEIYKSSSINGKYKKIATTRAFDEGGEFFKYGEYKEDGTFLSKYDVLKQFGGLSWLKVRGINGSKKGAFSSKYAWYLYYPCVKSVKNNDAKTKTIIQFAVDNSKSKTSMYICTDKNNNKIRYISEYIWNEDDETKSPSKYEDFTYYFVDDEGNVITDDAIVVPEKSTAILNMVVDNANVKKYYELSTDGKGEGWDGESLIIPTDEMILQMKFYAQDGKKKINFSTELKTEDGEDAPYSIETVYSAK